MEHAVSALGRAEDKLSSAHNRLNAAMDADVRVRESAEGRTEASAKAHGAGTKSSFGARVFTIKDLEDGPLNLVDKGERGSGGNSFSVDGKALGSDAKPVDFTVKQAEDRAKIERDAPEAVATGKKVDAAQKDVAEAADVVNKRALALHEAETAEAKAIAAGGSGAKGAEARVTEAVRTARDAHADFTRAEAKLSAAERRLNSAEKADARALQAAEGRSESSVGSRAVPGRPA
ncbi:hypothetical protein, partial [Streptomyces tsukubensis]|uniref:hypothetical protein n=1 Tax=Streptomyces tsukubensis TaxID=83656 RepID=UPI001C4DEC64